MCLYGDVFSSCVVANGIAATLTSTFAFTDVIVFVALMCLISHLLEFESV